MGALARRAAARNTQALSELPAALGALRRQRLERRAAVRGDRAERDLEGRTSKFTAPLRSTIDELATELRGVGAEGVIVELDFEERHLRLDGDLRSSARLESGAVALSFNSRYGPMRFATGQHPSVPENLRAVILTMGALRAIDRHGVAKSGEQYQGWKAIPRTTGPSDPAAVIPDLAAARRLLEQWGGDVTRAIKETHPDRGGTAEQFALVMRAKELVEA